MPRLALALLLAAGLRSCVAYDYEHEFWLRVDGSGTVNVTGRPALWASFKGYRGPESDTDALKQGARDLFERSGLRVKRVTLTRRRGQAYLFVSADFADVNRLAGTPAFPDLALSLAREGDHLRLDGAWRRRAGTPDPPLEHREGLLAVRFHLPSKIYGHRNAFAGVERGNIVGWRETVAEGVAGRALELGAQMDQRSILLSTVTLFAVAVALALSILALVVLWAVRKGRTAGA